MVVEDNPIKCISYEEPEVRPSLKNLEKSEKKLKKENNEKQENPIKFRMQETKENVKLHM